MLKKQNTFIIIKFIKGKTKGEQAWRIILYIYYIKSDLKIEIIF